MISLSANIRPGGAHLELPGPAIGQTVRAALRVFFHVHRKRTRFTALGIARHAIDTLTQTAAEKPARCYTFGERPEAPKALRDDVYIQDDVARVETLLTSAC